MIPLTKEKIDFIFEPRRPIKSHELESAGIGRLLTDGEGRFYCVTRERCAPNGWAHIWHTPSRKEPGYEIVWSQRRYKKGTWPAWIAIDVPSAERLYECLPGPTHQAEVLLAFYHIAFPNWDDIVKIDSWPRVSETTWKYIWEKFAAFDRQFHPDVIPAGAWALGSGFSSARTDKEGGAVPDWCIDISPCTIAYKWTPFRCMVDETRNEFEGKEWSRFTNHIEWDVFLKGQWSTSRLSEAIDPSYNERPQSREEAIAQCEKRVGCPLTWESVKPHHESIDAEWSTPWALSQTEAERAA